MNYYRDGTAVVYRKGAWLHNENRAVKKVCAEKI
jgi:hypothetical protein